MTDKQKKSRPENFRSRLREIIFETNTRAGKAFDVVLIVCILLSVLAVMLDSVRPIKESWGAIIYGAQWFFTIIFAVEYGLRLYSTDRPLTCFGITTRPNLSITVCII